MRGGEIRRHTVFAFKRTRRHPSAAPQAGLTAPHAVPAETLAILLSSPRNLGSSATVKIVHAGKCGADMFSYFRRPISVTISLDLSRPTVLK
eukprot:COSAG06_NODE_2199_length_7365_cov_4.321222_11_plen_92_part_00